MLEIKNLIKKFPGHFEPTINDLCLTIKEGDFCILLGANGSGKSTFLKLISGEYEKDKGDIVNIPEKDIALVVQDINKGIIPELTLLENIILSSKGHLKSKLSFYSKQKQNIINKVKSLNLGLEKYIDKPMSCLSGGQKQMIATLMAVSSEPKLLLLDEHTSALDPTTAKMLMNYTANHIESMNTTAIMITHKLDEAVKYGNRLLIMSEGKIVLDLDQKQKSLLTEEKILNLFIKYSKGCI